MAPFCLIFLRGLTSISSKMRSCSLRVTDGFYPCCGNYKSKTFRPVVLMETLCSTTDPISTERSLEAFPIIQQKGPTKQINYYVAQLFSSSHGWLLTLFWQ